MAIQETRIITKRLHDRPDDSWTIDGSLASGGYKQLEVVLRHGDPSIAQAAGTA